MTTPVLAALDGIVIVEFPATEGSTTMAGRLLAVYDAVTDKQIMTITSLDIHADATGVVTVEASHADPWPNAAPRTAKYLLAGVRIRF
jgi:hypothetical protein